MEHQCPPLSNFKPINGPVKAQFLALIPLFPSDSKSPASESERFLRRQRLRHRPHSSAPPSSLASGRQRRRSIHSLQVITQFSINSNISQSKPDIQALELRVIWLKESDSKDMSFDSFIIGFIALSNPFRLAAAADKSSIYQFVFLFGLILLVADGSVSAASLRQIIQCRASAVATSPRQGRLDEVNQELNEPLRGSSSHEPTRNPPLKPAIELKHVSLTLHVVVFEPCSLFQMSFKNKLSYALRALIYEVNNNGA
ncbi:hypothetical protein DM860_001722 [Cuscuta australis]|uniref:Uncharacterized protein n=1 Tax=Cuscuta australis TaxID=267555 RepID=A0A328E9F2_9ASTE|nr:hypothetical protein DM860_001722 [Cuscuta australis]